MGKRRLPMAPNVARSGISIQGLPGNNMTGDGTASEPTCVITGGSRGIGFATALRFARGGSSVLIAARGQDQLQKAAVQVAATGATCEFVVADVGGADGAQRVVDAAIHRFGRLDVLVNNAGYAPLAPLEELTTDVFEQAWATNVASVFYCTRAAWPHMTRQGGGTIVNLSSMASFDPFRGFSVYGACKAWVNLFTRAVAAEGASHGVRVFAVAPGSVETEMLRSVAPGFPAEETLDPDDVAAVIQSLCDARLRYASGQTITVRK